MNDQQIEALLIAAEEAAEVIQAISKIRRSGTDFCPFGGPTSNLDNLQNELADFAVLLEMAGVKANNDPDYRAAKIYRLERWSPHAVPEGFQ